MTPVTWERLAAGWRSLGIDLKMLSLMLKGSIPVAISLAIYQSTPVSEVYTNLGFLVAIIAVVTVNLLPRAKLLQMTFAICAFTAIAIPLAMLATWSGLQARHHTDPEGLHAYNSSQSAITGVWLFFHIWLSNSIQARYPALLIPTILYNIFMIVQLTSCSRFATWKQCWDLIYLTIRCYYTGIAISFVTGILIYPVTCRTEIFEVQEKYLHSARETLNRTLEYLAQLSEASPAAQSGSRGDGSEDGDGLKAASALKEQAADLKALYVKMHEELAMAKREVSWGKLSAKNITTISDLCRRILMPILGVSHIPDILNRADKPGKLRACDDEDEPPGQPSARTYRDLDEHGLLWQDAVKSLIGSATELVKAVKDGLEHAGLQLEVIPRPGKTKLMHFMPGPQRDEQTDTEAKGEIIEPGDPVFSHSLEERVNAFSRSRSIALAGWLDREETAEGLSQAARQQLHLVMYVQQMLYATGVSTLELCKFSDQLVSEGVMARNRLIAPSPHRLWTWLLSIFDTADAALPDDDRPHSKKEAVLVYGSSSRTTRNVEHLAPQNAYERLGARIGRFQEFLKGPEFSFGFRSACATMSCAILAYLHQTQDLFTHYRLIWSVIIAAIGANMSAGQSGVSYVLRILGSFAALIICYLVWYIPDGHIAGVIILMWFASFIQMYFLIRWPRYIIGWLVILITEVLSIGYLCQVSKIGVEAATATGVIYYRPYSVAAVRVACVLWGTLASMFFTYLPYPITARGILRKDLAAVMHLIANYQTVVHHTLTARLEGTEGDMLDKRSQGSMLARRRRAIFNKVMVLNSSVKHSVYLQKYEPTLGGKFPVAIYTEILTQVSALLDYMALISYCTQSWSTHSTHAQYVPTYTHTREWMADLAALIGPANASTVSSRSILYQLSGAVLTGRPLPSKIETAKALQLSQVLQQLDPASHVYGIPDLGYSTYAVTEILSSVIAWRIDMLAESIEKLVGIAFFDVEYI